MTHHRFDHSERDSLHFQLPHRTRSYGFGDFAKDVGGVGIGIVEGIVDTATGIVDAVTNPVETVTAISKLITDPAEAWPAVWNGVVDPIVDDWQNGNPGEAIGRGGWAVFEVVFGAKGLTKIGKAGGVTKAPPGVPDAPRPDTVPKTDAPKPDAPKPDAPKPDAPKPDARKVDPRRQSVIDDLQLSPENAAFAERVDVDHIFNGGATSSGATNGGHVAPGGPGRHGPLSVREIDNPDKPYRPGQTWRAKVQHDGATKGKTSTMYPREWSNDDIVTAIREAEQRATFDKVHASAGSDPDVLWGVGTHRGIEISIQKNVRTGEIVTAYPRASGVAFSE